MLTIGKFGANSNRAKPHRHRDRGHFWKAYKYYKYYKSYNTAFPTFDSGKKQWYITFKERRRLSLQTQAAECRRCGAAHSTTTEEEDKGKFLYRSYNAQESP